MYKKLLITIVSILTIPTLIYAQTVFRSSQVGTSPASNLYLKTDGVNSFWAAVTGGGGGGAGTFSTSTAWGTTLYNYPINATDIVCVGYSGSGVATSSNSEFCIDPIAKLALFLNSTKLGVGTTTPWRTFSVNGSSDLGTNALAGYFTATTSTASVFPLANITKLSNLTSNGFVKTSGADGTLSVDTNSYLTGSGAGVTAVSVASSNGFAGSSSGGATPALTLSTTISGLLKGNGTAISAAANGTDYTLLTSTTCGAGAHISAVTAAGAVTCSSDSGGGGASGGTWATTTSTVSGQLINYPNNTTDIVAIGSSATSTAGFYFDPNTNTARIGLDSGFLGGAVYKNGLSSTKTQLMLTGPVNDLQSNLVIGNTYSGTDGVYATGGITFVNGRSTQGATFQTSDYYTYLGLAGPRFAAFTGLPPNGFVMSNTSGPVIIGATSANVASGTIAFAIGSGYAVGNYDMILKNVDTSGSTDTASGGLGLGTTTPDARLTLLASSTATFDYLNVYQHVNGVTTGIPVFNVNKNENVGIASTTPWGRLSINPNGISGPAFVIGSSTGTKLIVDNGGKVGIGTTTPVSTLDVRGSFHVEEQNIATSTSMSVDFCSSDTSNLLRGGPSSSNITFTWTNYSTCPGKSIIVVWYNPSSGLIGSTTFTAAKLHWNGYIDPGSNVNLGGIDKFVFTSSNGSSTPYIDADLIKTLP
jgi:hypothetical protein